MTSCVKRFLFNLRSTAKGTEWREGMLSGREIAEADQMWIKAAQDAMKSRKHYEDLALKLKLVQNNGLLRCKGTLECSDLELE